MNWTCSTKIPLSLPQSINFLIVFFWISTYYSNTNIWYSNVNRAFSTKLLILFLSIINAVLCQMCVSVLYWMYFTLGHRVIKSNWSKLCDLLHYFIDWNVWYHLRVHILWDDNQMFRCNEGKIKLFFFLIKRCDEWEIN